MHTFQAMNKFILEGKSLTKKIKKLLNIIDEESTLVVGGGLAYESTRYLEENYVGDYDYIITFNSLSKLKKFISSKVNFTDLGFDKNSVKNIDPIDIKLFNDSTLGVIGLSANINGVKVSLNITTTKRFKEYIRNKKRFYKSKQGNLFNPFYAKGSNGEELISCRISPEVSTLYKDGQIHYLTLIDPYYWNGDSLHLGIHTDFIAKGIIVKDNSKADLTKYQAEIWKLMKSNASANIIENKTWHTMFASSQYFSQKFIKKINQDIEKIKYSPLLKKHYFTNYSKGEAITSFAEKDLYANKYLLDIERNLNLKKITDFLIKKKDFMQDLKAMNEETMVLSLLISKLNKAEVIKSILESNKVSLREINLIKENFLARNILSLRKSTLNFIKNQ